MISSFFRPSAFRLFALASLALGLAACAPRLSLPTDEPVISEAREFGTVPFGPFETYFERVGAGAGQPLLLIHGIGGGSSLFQYRKNAAVLAHAGYDVWSLDLLGFGRSSRPDIRYTQDLHVRQIEDFLRRVVEDAGEPAVVVANGLSAAYTIRLAAERPELVSRLVLIGPTGYERLERPATEARVQDFERFVGGLGRLLYLALLDEGSQRFFLLDAYAGPDSLTPEVLASYDRNLRAENAEWVILSFISGNLDQPVADFWPELEQPTLLVWGAEARTTPPEDAEAFLAARPETEFLLLDGARLLPNEDRAEAFNRAVLDFLSRHP